MASKETLGRIRHIDLCTQQRRLRHLHSISARNIIPCFPLSGDSLVDCLLETYFSLHKQDSSHSKAIYTSEKITYSLNPTWTSFELNTLVDSLQTSTSMVLVRLWGGHNTTFCLLLEWKVDLTLLQYLGDQIRTTRHPPNTLIFGLVDGYYGAPCTVNLKSTEVEASPSYSLKVDIEQVIPSCNVASLQRLSSLLQAIRQTQISVLEYQQSIEDRLLTSETSMLKLAKRESIKLKVKLLREELTTKLGMIKKEKEEEKKLLQAIRKRERNFTRKRKEFEEKTFLLREHKQAHVDKRETLVKVNAQLNMRKRQLACELTYIYPILELDEKNFVICGVRLPNSESEEFLATDDETLSCSLGYACHLVYMISKILELPQRYTMHPMGSRSTVMDYTIDKVADKDKEFPLHTKGKERIQFRYGIFLLNKNIAQLRQYCTLGTPNLRNTLPNIKDILVTKFRASSDANKSTPPYSIHSNDENDSTSVSTPQSNDVLIRDMKNPVTKPLLMPKPLNITTTHSKPALPPKPPSMLSKHDDLTDTKIGMLVNIHYEQEQENHQLQTAQIEHEKNSPDIKNNGVVRSSVESSILPPSQGAPHRFFEKRQKKGSRSKSTPNQTETNQAPAMPETKAEKRWREKRNSLDLRGVPVEVIREREALQKRNDQQNSESQSSCVEQDSTSVLGSKPSEAQDSVEPTSGFDTTEQLSCPENDDNTVFFV